MDLDLVAAMDQIRGTDGTDTPLRQGCLDMVEIVALFSRNVYSCGEAFGYS